MSEKMEHNASIDAVYEVVERIEQQKKRLTRSVMVISISAMLGLVFNGFFFMMFSHQKGALDNINIIYNGLIFLICTLLLSLAIKKYILLKKIQNFLKIKKMI